jgi:DNA-directed RNA polymerase specialized sigma24 family protein
MTAAASEVVPYRNPQEPDYNELVGICRAIIKKKRYMFDAHPDISNDDLLQEGLIAAGKAHRMFDPTNGGTYKTWIGRFVHFRFIDLARVRGRERTKGKAYIATKSELSVQSEVVPPEETQIELASVPAVAAQSLLVARRTMPKYRRGSHRRFSQPQLMAILVIRSALRTSYRGVVITLANSPILQASINLTEAPDFRTVFYFGQKIGKPKVVAAVLAQARAELERVGEN